MEFPNLGEHCEETSCNKLDFLPFKCDCCQKVFCKDHINYAKHNCTSSNFKTKDFQIPLCPLCNQPVPYKRNELPDASMSAHIDRDCKSDPAEERRRKIFSNRCSLKGCKNKELIPFLCTRCNRNYCIRHRHETDHECNSQARLTSAESNRAASSLNKNSDVNNKRLQFFQFNKPQQQQQTRSLLSTTTSSNAIASSSSSRPTHSHSIQPSSLSDAEALEQAIKMSLSESSQPNTTTTTREETEDELLARVLAQSELEYNRQQGLTQENKKDNCSIN